MTMRFKVKGGTITWTFPDRFEMAVQLDVALQLLEQAEFRRESERRDEAVKRLAGILRKI